MFLGFFLLSYGIPFISTILTDLEMNDSTVLFYFPVRFYFFAFPFLYLYTLEITKTFEINNLIKHIYPAILEFLIISSLFFIMLQGRIILPRIPFNTTYQLFACLFNVLYLFRILAVLNEHKKKMYDFHSEVSDKLFDWIRILAIGFLAVVIGNIVLIIQPLFYYLDYGPLLSEETSLIGQALLSSINLALIFWAVVSGIKQHYTSPGNKVKQKSTTNPDVEDYDIIYKKLLVTIELTKCYKNKELTIVDLAKLVGEHHRKLSRAINHRTNSNFNSFINKYRVEEAKRILQDPKQSGTFTMEGLGYEVGFKTRSSMYMAFKKSENCTPGEFKRKMCAI